MKNSNNKKLKKKHKKNIENSCVSPYQLNEGGFPRTHLLIAVSKHASDSDFLKAFITHVSGALFPLEDNKIMDIRERGPEGDTLLHEACRMGSLRAVRLLIEAGIDINSLGDMDQTPLHCAVSGRFLDIIDLLLSKRASPHLKDGFGYSPLE